MQSIDVLKAAGSARVSGRVSCVLQGVNKSHARIDFSGDMQPHVFDVLIEVFWNRLVL
jgi:hypothetical protein